MRRRSNGLAGDGHDLHVPTVELNVAIPNFSYVGAHCRIFRPVSARETEVQLFPIMLKGVSSEVNSTRLRIHEPFFRPAGNGQSDDLEVFERNQIGLATSHQPWSLNSRGEHLKKVDNDDAISGQITAEMTNCVMFCRWKQLMSQEEPA